MIALALSLALAGAPPAPPADPVAAEVARCRAMLENPAWTDPLWTSVKSSAGPALDNVEAALSGGHRLLALLRLGDVRTSLQAGAYARGRLEGATKDPALFETEWKRLGEVLREDLRAPAPSTFDTVRPAAVRAIAEATLPQVRAYHEASREFGVNRMLDGAFYYLGTALAQRDHVRFCTGLEIEDPAHSPSPALRPLGPDLDALEAELLAAYLPPASIDRHGEFIGASAALKEARDLDAWGLRHGALLRYLQAAVRFAPLRPVPVEGGDPARRLAELEARLSAGDADHGIGRIFLELARADATRARDVAGDVLPRYLAALAPARPVPPRPAPEVTVTLVRWPYT